MPRKRGVARYCATRTRLDVSGRSANPPRLGSAATKERRGRTRTRARKRATGAMEDVRDGRVGWARAKTSGGCAARDPTEGRMEHAAAAWDVRARGGVRTPMAADVEPRPVGRKRFGMTTDVASATLPSSLARPTWRARLRLEHVVMGGAILALVVLVVLPLLSLLLGSVKGEAGLSLDHFSEVLSGRLYLTALKNSLILGAWTGLFSLVIGLALAWAGGRTDVPAKPLIQLTATLSYLSPPFLTAIALTYLFSPNAGLVNVLMRDVAGLPWLTFNIFTMSGLVLVT